MPRPQRKGGPARRTPLEHLTDAQLRQLAEWGGYHPDESDRIEWRPPSDRNVAIRIMAERHPDAPPLRIGPPVRTDREET